MCDQTVVRLSYARNRCHDYIVSPHMGFMSFCDTLLPLWLDVWLSLACDGHVEQMQHVAVCSSLWRLQAEDEWGRMKAGSASTAQRPRCCPHSAASQDSVSLVSSAVSSTIWTSGKTEISFASMMNWLRSGARSWCISHLEDLSAVLHVHPACTSAMPAQFCLSETFSSQFLNAISRTDD